MRCLVFGCKNYRISKNTPPPKLAKKYCDPNISYFRLPSKGVRINEGYGETRTSILTRARREAWIKALTAKQELSETQLANGRVCQRHFIAEKPSSLDDKKNKDWVPHLHMDSEACCYGSSRKCHRIVEETSKDDSRKDQIDSGTIIKDETEQNEDKAVANDKENTVDNDEKDIKNADEVTKDDESSKELRCRTCLAVIGSAKHIKLTENLLSVKELKTMLKGLVGVMDLERLENPVMCLKCEKILKLSYSFKSRCERIETSLKFLKTIKPSKETKPNKESNTKKRNLRSCIKPPKRFSEDENNPKKEPDDSEKIKEEPEEKGESEDAGLVLDDLEKDIKAEIEVDGDILDLIKHEVKTNEDSDIIHFLQMKFQKEPGVKIVPYMIPGQVICVPQDVADKMKKNTENSDKIPLKALSEESVSQSVEKSKEITKEKDVAKSDNESDNGATDDYFENFEPDWFKANDKKRKNQEKTVESTGTPSTTKQAKPNAPLIVYTGEGSYVPKQQTINKTIYVSKSIIDSKNPTPNKKAKVSETTPDPPTEQFSNQELQAILEGEVDKVETAPVAAKDHQQPAVDKAQTEEIAENVVDKIPVCVKKDVEKLVKVDTAHKLKTYSKESKDNKISPIKNAVSKENTTENVGKLLKVESIDTEIQKPTSQEVLSQTSENIEHESEVYLDENSQEMTVVTKDEYTNYDSMIIEAETDSLDSGPLGSPTHSQNSQTSKEGHSNIEEYIEEWSKLHQEDERFLSTLHGPKYPCNKCRGSYNTKIGLRRHLRTHYNAPYVDTPEQKRRSQVHEATCNICGTYIRHRSSMYRHMKKHINPPEGGAFEQKQSPCNFCNKVFASQHSLKLHLRVHYKKNTIKPTINNKSPTKASQPKKTQPYKISPRQTSQISTVPEKVTKNPKYKCVMCSFGAKTDMLLKKHYLEAHSYHNKQNTDGKEPAFTYQCELCDHLYEYEEDLKIHVQTHFERDEANDQSALDMENGEEIQEISATYDEVHQVYICNKCGMGFADTKDLGQHFQAEHCEVGYEVVRQSQGEYEYVEYNEEEDEEWVEAEMGEVEYV